MAELSVSTTADIVDELVSRGGHIICTATDDQPAISADIDARRAADLLNLARERIENSGT